MCEDSPRLVGPFGAMDKPRNPIPLAGDIRSQLSQVEAIRALKQTRLDPLGEQVIMYDTKEGLAPEPRVAVVVSGSLKEAFDVAKLDEYGDGAVYATSCEFDLSPTRRALAIVYTFSGDGTGSLFLILSWSGAGKYSIIFHRSVMQGRIVLGSRALELWEPKFGKYSRRPDSDKFECIWCPHRYLITEFEWQNGEYMKKNSKRTREAYNPAEITGTPIQIRQGMP